MLGHIKYSQVISSLHCWPSSLLLSCHPGLLLPHHPWDSFPWSTPFHSYFRKGTWEGGAVFKTLHVWKCLNSIYTLEWSRGNNFCTELWEHCFTGNNVVVKKPNVIWIPGSFPRTCYSLQKLSESSLCPRCSVTSQSCTTTWPTFVNYATLSVKNTKNDLLSDDFAVWAGVPHTATFTWEIG